MGNPPNLQEAILVISGGWQMWHKACGKPAPFKVYGFGWWLTWEHWNSTRQQTEDTWTPSADSCPIACTDRVSPITPRLAKSSVVVTLRNRFWKWLQRCLRHSMGEHGHKILWPAMESNWYCIFSVCSQVKMSVASQLHSLPMPSKDRASLQWLWDNWRCLF